MEAASRAYSAPAKKAPQFEPLTIVVIASAYRLLPALVHTSTADAIFVRFIVVGRFDDICQLRFDAGFFEDYEWDVRFFFDRRKQISFAISRPLAPSAALGAGCLSKFYVVSLVV